MNHRLKAFATLHDYFSTLVDVYDQAMYDTDDGRSDAKSRFKETLELEINDIIKELEQLKKAGACDTGH